MTDSSFKKFRTPCLGSFKSKKTPKMLLIRQMLNSSRDSQNCFLGRKTKKTGFITGLQLIIVKN